MDRCTKGLPRFQNLRHFAQGISVISLWTGKEAKALGRTFLLIVAGYEKQDLVKATKAVVDFMTRAHKHEVTERDVTAMRQDLLDFNSSKGVFVNGNKKGMVKHQNHFHKIPKIHSLTHYPYLICDRDVVPEFCRRLSPAGGFWRKFLIPAPAPSPAARSRIPGGIPSGLQELQEWRSSCY
ncbi:cation transporter/ATPase, amino-terminal protein [Ceratobasidium sp. AG-Ba]|nr:cation transporter/ATPase, amino-terminal protein [Ceratobasidium sp. AG-Ba]QRW03418.1 cation transporter/ATPase, amino-terminal protein [Ceratobasidium sp. AG-Ba]